MTSLYKSSIVLAASGVEPDVTFKIFVTVRSLSPGLVGGHCIGVDPYYLAQKAQESGYYPEIILAGRRINDSMGSYVASEVVKKMVQKNIPVKDSKALILGFTFKENCPDVRNTRVIDIYRDLEEFGLKLTVFDPWIEPKEVASDYDINISSSITKGDYNVIIMAVAHDQFSGLDFDAIRSKNSLIYDIKGVMEVNSIDSRL